MDEPITGKLKWQELETGKTYSNGKKNRRVLGFGKWPIGDLRSLDKTITTRNGDVVFVEDGADKRNSVTVSAFLNWMRRGMGKKRCPTCKGTGEVKKKAKGKAAKEADAPKAPVQVTKLGDVQFDRLYAGPGNSNRLVREIWKHKDATSTAYQATHENDRIVYVEWIQGESKGIKNCLAKHFITWANERS